MHCLRPSLGSRSAGATLRGRRRTIKADGLATQDPIWVPVEPALPHVLTAPVTQRGSVCSLATAYLYFMFKLPHSCHNLIRYKGRKKKCKRGLTSSQQPCQVLEQQGDMCVSWGLEVAPPAVPLSPDPCGDCTPEVCTGSEHHRPDCVTPLWAQCLAAILRGPAHTWILDF